MVVRGVVVVVGGGGEVVEVGVGFVVPVRGVVVSVVIGVVGVGVILFIVGTGLFTILFVLVTVQETVPPEATVIDGKQVSPVFVQPAVTPSFIIYVPGATTKL